MSARQPPVRWSLLHRGLTISLLVIGGCGSSAPVWEEENPIRPVAPAPLGMKFYFLEAKDTPAPTRVRLGRWLFYDTRLSSDNTVACATCHRPEHAFSEPTPLPVGIRKQRGTRKTPSFINQAVTRAPHFFWDGRASSLEEQVLHPIENPIEMGSTHADVLRTLSAIRGYRPYFREAFGTEDVTLERVARAIADYERTRISGNSAYDRWAFNHEENAMSPDAKRGHDLFFDKARCAPCHLGSNFTDSRFWNLGVGWNAETQAFKDAGRFSITKDSRDTGAFKTPGLREVSRRAPYMHDGSVPTLTDVVELYNRGGIQNPWLTRRLVPLGLTVDEVRSIVAFLESLEGEGYQDVAPLAFPQ